MRRTYWLAAFAGVTGLASVAACGGSSHHQVCLATADLRLRAF
jgi:hypothetical protein